MAFFTSATQSIPVAAEIPKHIAAVSYTHLDVYKRQVYRYLGA